MKKRLLMLLSLFMAVTSVGWLHAEDAGAGSITSEITVAEKGKPIVFGITTKKGNVLDNTMVRVSLKADNDAFDNWESFYYEPNTNTPGWKEWDPNNDAFGPAGGFPFMDATSYIKVIPATVGIFTYTLNVTKVGEEKPFITEPCTLKVKEGAVSPVASIGDTDYASLATAVLFAKENSTISLSKGNFSLDQMLVIEKPLTISGAGVGTDGTGIQCRIVNGEKQWSIPAGKEESEYNHLLAILNGSAGQTVTIQGLNIVGALASGLNAQSAMKVVLKNVGMVGNANAGLLVHSEVEATNIYTVDNIWGGVNVDKGASNYTRKFTFDAASSFGEPSKIWAEKANAEDVADLVVCPKDQNWSCFEGLGGKDGKVAMYYWMNSKLTVENVAEFYTDKTLKDGFTLIYANGNPITVEASGADKVKISAGPDDVLEVATAKNPIIFGGAKFADVESSSITMKSGEVYMLVGGGYLGNVKNANVTVNGGNVTKYLVGGGYGPTQAFTAANRKTADVTNASVKINKGAIVRYLISGGLMYAKTTATDIQITEAAIEYALGGGYAPVGIKQSEQTDFATNVNTIETAKFLMTGGTVKGAICLGGGYSYSYTKNMTATIDGVAITGGLYGIGWNGRSDKVNATIKNSSFTKPESGYSTIASLVRGKADEISMAFNNCTFVDQYECYLSADNDWQDGAYPTPVSGKTTITFVGENTPVVKVSEGMQDVTVIGAEVKVEKFLQKKENTFIDKFEVPSGKTWSFPKGMTIVNGATLTNNGTLNLPASAIMAGIAAGGTLSTDATSADVVKAMNEATSKSDLSSKTFSIACKDGVIASNETVAKDLLKEGKVVMLLSFNEAGDGDHYSIASFQRTLAKITNLPDSVVYGTEPIKLAFNYKVAEAKISGTDNGIVKIENGVLTILKPGEVKLDITPDTNDDNKVDESDDADTKSTQTLKVTKRTLTLTAGIVPDYGNGSKGDSIVYDANKNVTLKWDAANIAVSGLPWESVGFISTCFDTTVAPTGTRANKNVGSKVPVKVGAITLKDSADYYTLAPITFVTAKVVKAPVTVTANNVDYIFGSDLPTFKATTTGLLGSPADVLDGTLKFICPATPDSLVKDGGYAIMPYGLTSDNYAIKYVAGKLTVKPTNPKIEIVDSKVIGTTGAKTITVQAKLVHAGGLETATVTAKDAESEVTSASENAITPDANGIYKFEVANAAAKKHTITFTATTTESSNNTGTASIDVTVEAGTPQNLKFDDKVLSSIVYGDSLPLIVLSDQSAAIGKYTFSAKEGEADAAIISANNVLKPSKAGDVVVTVSREADETYSSATITKTIKVNPRPLKASVAAFTPKTYDGSVTATVPAITLSADYKVIGTDKVNIKTDATPTATYASKNVGTHAITLSTLELDGAQKDNYTLIQPTGLTGEITKKDATVKVDDVTRMYNQRYTKYTFTPTGLVDGESLSSVYTGKLEVTENEKEGKLTLKIDGSLCQNYNLTPEDGELTVTKGTPVVVAYNKDNVAQALVVDSAGHQNLTVSKDLVDGYFLVTGDDKKVTKSVNAISLVQTTALLSTKAGDEWAGWNSEEATTIEYAATGQTTTNVSDYTYSSTDLNRLSINGTDLTASGVGKVAIIATNTTSGDVKVKLYDVKPKTVTYKAEMNKTYDGLTQATGTVTLEGVEGNDNVVLDLEGVTFNYTSPKAGTYEINPSQAPILMGTDANNYNLVSNVSGKIAEKEITVSTPISAYYTGKTDMTLNEFTSEGVLSNDIVSLNVSLDKAEVGPREFTLIELEGDNAGNYTLSKKGTLEGTILKPTIVVTVPETAPSAPEVKNRLTYTIRETGEVVSKDVFGKNVKVVSLGNNVYQVSTTEENPNYSLVYTKNLIGYKSEGSDTPGGDGDETVTISLDATTKTLPRNEEFVLKATVSNGKTVTWSSSDPTIASVTADGNKATVKGLKVGKATITAKIGDVTASCEVTVDFATGLEEALANTQVYAKQGNIYVNPVQPLQLTIVNMIGKVVYNARISSYAQIPVAKGIYIVKLTNAGNTVVTKVNVY